LPVTNVSAATWTLSVFVVFVPSNSVSMPESTTSVSPEAAPPVSSAASTALSRIVSMSWAYSVSTGRTPHERELAPDAVARRRRDHGDARPEHRRLAGREPGLRDGDHRGGADVAREVACGAGQRLGSRALCGSRNALFARLRVLVAGLDLPDDPVIIVSTTLTGSSPIAVSPDSITASVPSRTAFATDGRLRTRRSAGETIESSISVAVMTGTPALTHFRMIRF